MIFIGLCLRRTVADQLIIIVRVSRQGVRGMSIGVFLRSIQIPEPSHPYLETTLP
jgi:hypothetical protein